MLAASIPQPPGRFSITTGCLSVANNSSPTALFKMSAAPPAAKGVMIFIGHDVGCSWDQAEAAGPINSAVAKHTRHIATL
jgi:hypothetical protein